MPQNTIYNPENRSMFSKQNLLFSGKTIAFSCLANSESNGDLTLTDDSLLTGGILLVKNGNFFDEVSLQIVHPTLGVVNEFVTKYRIVEDEIRQFMLDLDYPAKIPAGLSIRVQYKASNNGQSTREIAINLFLHKVLT